MKRQMMGRSQSRRQFSNGASRHHKKNFAAAPMRGGIRL